MKYGSEVVYAESVSFVICRVTRVKRHCVICQYQTALNHVAINAGCSVLRTRFFSLFKFIVRLRYVLELLLES